MANRPAEAFLGFKWPSQTNQLVPEEIGYREILIPVIGLGEMTCLNLPDQSASLLSGGNLVPFRSKLHIKYLEPRRSFGPKGVPRPLFEPYCYHSYRQHHGGCLFKEGGGVSRALFVPYYGES